MILFGIATVVTLAFLALMDFKILLAFVGASIILPIALIRPKIMVLIGVLGLLAGRTVISSTSIFGAAYIDEFFVVISIIAFPIGRMLAGQSIRRFPGDIWFLVFVIFGIVGGIVNQVPFQLLLVGAFLMIKGPLLGWAIAQIDWGTKDLIFVCRVTGLILLFIFACVIINFAIPDTWMSLILEEGVSYDEKRFGVPIIIGPFAHPGYFGTLMALAGIGILTYRSTIRKTKFGFLLLAGTLLALVASFRRKTLLAFGAVLLAFPLVTRKIRTIPIVVGLLGLTIFFGWDLISTVLAATYIEYFVDSESVARIRLTLDAPIVAASHFPFGAGFGRFGSGIARQYYSPEYIALGYPSVWGLGPTVESGKFLTDTFWPAVIGETGFFGCFAYVMAIITIWKRSRSFCKSHISGVDSWGMWLGLTASLWTIELIMESVAEPVFMSTPVFGVYFGFIGLMIGYSPLYSTANDANRGFSRFPSKHPLS